ncbi:hypothetical protein [Larkinella sp. C7]|uniref:hypothetical protein n=1 Tax=Larkinella sp. C7 TaxID=2576607 RepID=UPI0011111148|nr:hypothetical protein [Larkinella sp. C7]
METFSVDLAQNDTSLAELEDYIRNTARQYVSASERAKTLLAEVGKETANKLAAGTPGYVYLKQLGHKPLATEDIERIITALGTDEEKAVVAEFPAAQRTLNDRLKGNPVIGLILKQAKISYDQYYQRQSLPERWTPSQMIAIIDVLERLRV